MITVKNLKKKFGNKVVLKGIDLNVEKGECVVIIGPSGCGKSTLLRCINGIEKLTSGKVIFEGKDIYSKNVDINKIREKMGAHGKERAKQFSMEKYLNNFYELMKKIRDEE